MRRRGGLALGADDADAIVRALTETDPEGPQPVPSAALLGATLADLGKASQS